MPRATLTPCFCPCRAQAKSVMDAYFVYSNGTALDVNELSRCVPGRGLCVGTAACTVLTPCPVPLGRLIQSDSQVLLKLVDMGLAIIVSGAGQGAWGEGTGTGVPGAACCPQPCSAPGLRGGDGDQQGDADDRHHRGAGGVPGSLHPHHDPGLGSHHQEVPRAPPRAPVPVPVPTLAPLTRPVPAATRGS